MTASTDLLRSGSALTCVVLWLLVTVGSIHGQENLGSPRLSDVSTLVVDQSSTSVGVLELRSGPVAVKGILTATDFQSSMTHEPLGARFMFTDSSETTGNAVYHLDLPANNLIRVKLEIANLWEAGESTAQLLFNGRPIGSLKAIKSCLPFAVRLGEATQGLPEVSFERRKRTSLLLKNDDPMTYPIYWQLILSGQTVSGNDVRLPPHSTGRIENLELPEAAFNPSPKGLLMPETQDAVLELSYRPPSGSDQRNIPRKSIPLRVHLHYWSPGQQQMAGAIVAGIVLFVGALLASLLQCHLSGLTRSRISL